MWIKNCQNLKKCLKKHSVFRIQYGLAGVVQTNLVATNYELSAVAKLVKYARSEVSIETTFWFNLP